jgi:hypothetical protein
MAYTVEQLQHFRADLATGTRPNLAEELALIEQLLHYEISSSGVSFTEQNKRITPSASRERNP